MFIVLAFQLFSNIIYVTADYGCLCIRGGTSDVHLQPFVLSPVLGQLKGGDCKPTFPAGTSVNWTAIQYHNQVHQLYIGVRQVNEHIRFIISIVLGNYS